MLLPPPVLAASPWPPLVCPAAAGLRLLSSPSFLFVLWPSLPASLSVCFLVCRLLPLSCLASCCVCWFFSCLLLLVCSSRIIVGLVGCACCQLTKVTKDCRGLPAPTSHTHTPATVISSLPSHLEVDLSLNSFVDFLVVLAVLVPLARLSCFVRGVGSSRPEPWTRLHCSELHWRDPVALSVGHPGAPVSSKDCEHGSNVLFRSRWHPAGPLGG